MENIIGVKRKRGPYKLQKKEDDPYESRVSNVKYGVFDADGELICKTRLRKEAKATIEEWWEIDKENNEKHYYYIRKLWGN